MTSASCSEVFRLHFHVRSHERRFISIERLYRFARKIIGSLDTSQSVQSNHNERGAFFLHVTRAIQEERRLSEKHLSPRDIFLSSWVVRIARLMLKRGIGLDLHIWFAIEDCFQCVASFADSPSREAAAPWILKTRLPTTLAAAENWLTFNYRFHRICCTHAQAHVCHRQMRILLSSSVISLKKKKRDERNSRSRVSAVHT